MMRKAFLIVAAAMLGGILPIQAQEQTEEFTIATLNVDGLPDSFLGISINPHGPGDKYTPEIADYLLQKDYDLVGFQENFNYYDRLFPPLEASYQHDECKGKISLSHFALPFPYDGINLIWHNGIEGEHMQSVRWDDSYGLYNHANDELTKKGFRRYDFTLVGGSKVVVYNGHWDASDDDDEAEGKDGPDRRVRLKQWIQLRDTILNHLDERPVIVMGDVNSYYCRDSVKCHFIDFIEATGKAAVSDAWIELERNGEFPDMVEGIVTHDEGGRGWVRQGEMLDKILFINPTDGSRLTPLSYSVDSMTYVRSDAPDVPLGDHFPVAVTFRIENFGQGGQTAIREMNGATPAPSSSHEWYALDGTRLAGRPTAPGVYIHNRKKIVIR